MVVTFYFVFVSNACNEVKRQKIISNHQCFLTAQITDLTKQQIPSSIYNFGLIEHYHFEQFLWQNSFPILFRSFKHSLLELTLFSAPLISFGNAAGMINYFKNDSYQFFV